MKIFQAPSATYNYNNKLKTTNHIQLKNDTVSFSGNAKKEAELNTLIKNVDKAQDWNIKETYYIPKGIKCNIEGKTYELQSRGFKKRVSRWSFKKEWHTKYELKVTNDDKVKTYNLNEEEFKSTFKNLKKAALPKILKNYGLETNLQDLLKSTGKGLLRRTIKAHNASSSSLDYRSVLHKSFKLQNGTLIGLNYTYKREDVAKQLADMTRDQIEINKIDYHISVTSSDFKKSNEISIENKEDIELFEKVLNIDDSFDKLMREKKHLEERPNKIKEEINQLSQELNDVPKNLATVNESIKKLKEDFI